MIVVQANHAPNSVIHCAGPRDRFTPIIKPIRHDRALAHEFPEALLRRR
jgi:hypothetical protein